MTPRDVGRAPRVVLGVACLLFALPGCAKKPHPTGPAPFTSGPTTVLDAGNPAGDDDDAAIALDPSGTLHVVWFSDRDGTKDLYTVRATSIDAASGRIQWSSPIQITHNDSATSPPPFAGDNYPSLLIDPDGTEHVAWHRVTVPSGASHVLTMRSDGSASGWAGAVVCSVSTGLHFDQFPNLVRFSPGELRAYFTSKTRGVFGRHDVFLARSLDNGTTWTAPQAVPSLQSATEQTSLASFVRDAGGVTHGVMERWKLEPSNDVLDPTGDIVLAQSPDGETWSVTPLTSDAGDALNDLAPAFFTDLSGALRVAWSTQHFGDPTEDLVQTAVADAAAYPARTTMLSASPGVPDHSPRLAVVSAAGTRLYVMVWVRGTPSGKNQIVYRVFASL